MKKYTSDKALEAIGLSQDELECLIREGKKLSKASASSAGQPNLELVFEEDGGYYKVRNYCDLYPAEDEVLIKPILLNEEIDGMKKIVAGYQIWEKSMTKRLVFLRWLKNTSSVIEA